MTAYDILTAAQDSIADPADWCQGHPRMDSQTCALYAVQDALSLTDEDAIPENVFQPLAQAATELYGRQTIVGVNDKDGHDAVMACFEYARALTREPVLA